MFAALLLGPPFVLAFALALATRRWRLVLLLGFALAVAFVVLGYVSAPRDYEHSQGDSDGEMFLGRWWEPQFTLLLTMGGLLGWVAGVGFGALLRLGLHPSRIDPAD